MLLLLLLQKKNAKHYAYSVKERALRFDEYVL